MLDISFVYSSRRMTLVAAVTSSDSRLFNVFHHVVSIASVLYDLSPVTLPHRMVQTRYAASDMSILASLVAPVFRVGSFELSS